MSSYNLNLLHNLQLINNVSSLKKYMETASTDNKNIIHEMLLQSTDNKDNNNILSNKTILQELVNGNIIINPFSLNNLAVGSYDVTLCSIYYRLRKPIDNTKILNIYSKSDIESKWELYKSQSVLEQAQLLKEWSFKWNGSDKDHIIWIDPNETLLCMTNEMIGGIKNITTKMFARSSMGRAGIQVCSCAGLGDVGYTNRWTLEIKNLNPYYKLPLLVDSRIAQIQFLRTDPLFDIDGYRSYTDQGKYQNNNHIDKEIDYTVMLPKLYKDKELLKSNSII